MVRRSVVREAGDRPSERRKSGAAPATVGSPAALSRGGGPAHRPLALWGWEGATDVPRSSQETSTDTRFVGRLGGRKGPHPWQPRRLASHSLCRRSPWCWAV